VILVGSIILRSLAFGWSLVLLWKVKDWRVGFLAAMLALMGLRQVLTLKQFMAVDDWRPSMNWSSVELPGLAVSVLAGLSVIFLTRLIQEQRHINKELITRDGELVQAQKMEVLGQLAGRTAHDFTNILTVIIGNAELARMHLPAGHQALEHIDELEKASQRGAEISGQVLSFSRKQGVERTCFDMIELIENIIAMIRQLLGDDVECFLRPMAAKAMVVADRAQIEQVLLNLTVNARDAMIGGGTLTIVTALDITGDEPMVAITFRDTGRGMSKEEQERAFEPFYTTKDIGKGTGLGLVTCLGNVERNGGTISIQDSSSAGTTFLLMFPQATDAASLPRRPIKLRENVGGSERVLIVDDEDQFRRLLCAGIQSSRLRGARGL